MADQAVKATREEAQRDKRLVALSSVGAAVGLTTFKLVVGFATGSIGILSEAAHSGLDLVAAAVTYFAVRASGRPADREHAYGHGKVENLSALFETGLLLATCAWIAWESLRRLFFQEAQVEVTPWSFGVMATSIVVDLSRSRALRRAARKHRSQALEADALHFATDVWSSTVVIVGLACVALAERLGAPGLVRADAIAALGVAGISLWVSLRLGKKSVDDLLDAAPLDLREAVARAAEVPGVAEVRQVRLRRSGGEVFGDVTVAVDGQASFERAHDTASEVEAAVRAEVPNADVVVHVEPARAGALPAPAWPAPPEAEASALRGTGPAAAPAADTLSPGLEALARRLAAAYAGLPGVRAVAVGGSAATGLAGPGSDLDLYVYATPEPPLAARAGVAAGSARLELGNRFFEPGDEWVDLETGAHIDAMFRDPAFVEEELDRALRRHQARVGYSTAFWHGVLHSLPLHDPSGWYAALQARSRAPYPPELVRAVVAQNHPLLRQNLSSFLAQLSLAVARGDAVSVNHRCAAFLASYLDVLLAVNRVPHPGEKRLLSLVQARCPLRPPRLLEDVEGLLRAATLDGDEVVRRADALGEGLDRLLRAEGLLPEASRGPDAIRP